MDKINLLVSYVFHKKNSLLDLDRFLKSILKFPPRSNCIIVISLKGLSARSCQIAKGMVDELKLGTKVQILVIDDVGYDIATHNLVCKKFCPKIILLMSATSEFMVENWQDLLIKKFNDPNVGAVGSMFSQESLKTGYYELLETRLRILLRLRLRPIHKNIATLRNLKIAPHIFEGKCMNYFLFFIFLLLFIRHKIFNPIGYRKHFPTFPNPHLRTTGLAVRGSIFVKLEGVLPQNKQEALIFESGFKNLSLQIERQKFKLYVVLPNGDFLIFRDKNASITYGTINSTAIIVDHAWRSFHNSPKVKQKAKTEILNQPRDHSILQILDGDRKLIVTLLSCLSPKKSKY